jgi:hypothetical protein
MRYENKFVLPWDAYADFQMRLLSSRFFFSEIYEERRVNNIYLDTEGYKNLYDNLYGVENRAKHRIRWYGISSSVNQPFLEYKIKHGSLGYKEYFSLPPFTFDTAFTYSDYLDVIKKDVRKKMSLYQLMYREMLEEVPTLFNTYLRRYYLSADGKFRLTIDRDLAYFAINRWFDGLPGFHEEKLVVEIKYENNDLAGAGAIMQELDLRLTRNSKYVIGMQGLYFNLFSS